jgi:hypothetical protein
MEKYRVNQEGRKVALRFQAFAVAMLLLVTGSPLTQSIAASLSDTAAVSKSADHAIPVSFFWLFTLGVAGLILLARVIQNIRHQNRVYLHHRHRPSMLDSHKK